MMKKHSIKGVLCHTDMHWFQQTLNGSKQSHNQPSRAHEASRFEHFEHRIRTAKLGYQILAVALTAKVQELVLQCMKHRHHRKPAKLRFQINGSTLLLTVMGGLFQDM
jgi:hypothetical protein